MEFYFFEISLAIVAVIVTWMGCKAIKGIWTRVKRRISYMVGKSQDNQGVANLNASESLASSSEPHRWKYDVFLSFRGTDTRKGIANEICDRLRSRGIKTFMDEQGLEVGDVISPTLIEAIKESTFAIVILSQNYASSAWCLEELREICLSMEDDRILPIFFEVDPTDVRFQKNSFKEAFSKHDTSGRHELEKVNQWRAALSKVANISGWNTNDFKTHSELVDNIVESLRSKVPLHPIESTDDFQAFGATKEAMRKVMEALTDDKITVVGVHGMAGVGKTSMVRHVAEQACKNGTFNHRIMAVVSQNPDLKKIQGTLAEMLGFIFEEEAEIGRACRLMQRIRRGNRILIILDDIRERIDLSNIGIPSYDELQRCRSKVLLTTRTDIVCHDMKCQSIIFLRVLSGKDSLTLFMTKARMLSASSHFCDVAKKVARACSGLPVALIAVAKALDGKCFDDWKEAARRLEASQSANLEYWDVVFNCIKLSYDYLKTDDARSCFLLCCLFPEDYDIQIEDLLKYGMGKGVFKEFRTMQDARVAAHLVVKDLKDCSLLLETEQGRCVKMHGVIRDVARRISTSEFFVQAGCQLEEWPSISAVEGYSAISLIRNTICKLPEKLVCPKLLILFLQSNVWLHEIPDHFFESLNELRVLDLSRTRISSLPTSFLILINLQTLYLDGCLSTIDNISILGKLKKLEILSMRELPLVELPKEIGDLSHLRMLDITGDYVDNVPSKVIGKLKLLEELYMQCNFADWGSNIEGAGEKNIVGFDELTGLLKLNVLKVFISDAKCLPRDVKDVPNWVNFDICIGRDPSIRKVSLVSSSSPAFTRALTLDTTINALPDWFIKAVTEKAEKLQYIMCSGLKNILVEYGCGTLHALKYLSVIGPSENLKVLMNTVTQVQNEPVFLNLEELHLVQVDCLEELCVGELPQGSLCNLRLLKVKHCYELVDALLPSQLLQRLKNLEELICVEIDELEYVFGCEGLNLEQIILTELKKMRLENLGKLIKIWNGPAPCTILQNLHSLVVSGCFELKILFTADVAQCLLQLEDLSVESCPLLERAVEANKDTMDSKIVFPKLKNVALIKLPQLTRFYGNSESAIECPLLESLNVERCPQFSTSDPLKVQLKLNHQQHLDNEQRRTQSELVDKIVESLCSKVPPDAIESTGDFQPYEAKKEVMRKVMGSFSSSLSMASSSSSSSTRSWKYDVFLSFRGPDTRKGIANEICNRLRRSGIKTFMDEHGLQVGDVISPTLIEAIKESRFAIVILSKNYASSAWCLEELREICLSMEDDRILPLFYQVDPTDVRYQKRSFEEAFSKHETSGRHESEKVNQWRAALSKVANISGWNTNDFKTHSELVEKIVESLRRKVPPNAIEFTDDFQAFGATKEATDKVMKALTDDKITAVGVYGMGGVGKTSMVRHVAAQACRNGTFDNWIMAVVSQKLDLEKVQDTLAELLGFELKDKTEAGRAAKLHKEIMRKEKLLIIVDDVWERTELSKIGIPTYNELQKCKSKVLLTMRRLNVCNAMKCHEKISLKVLSDQDSWTLFVRNAGTISFESTSFKEVAWRVAGECKNLPIALIAVARALADADQEEWEKAAERLKQSQRVNPNHEEDSFRCIRLSYDYLKNEDHKSCFLLCCLFPEDHDIEIEDLFRYAIGKRLFGDAQTMEVARGRLVTVVKYLKNSSLLLDSQKKGCVKMHDVIRDTAIQIAQSEEGHRFFVKAGCGLKGWRPRGLHEGCTAISLMRNEICKLPEEELVCQNLHILLLNGNEELSEIPEKLIQNLKELRVLDLSKTSISVLPQSFSLLTNLQALYLNSCGKLVDISVVGKLNKLEILSMRDCSLVELSREIGHLTNLKILDVNRHWGHGMVTIPSTVISKLQELEELYMVYCGFEEDGSCVAEGPSERTNIIRFDELAGLSNLKILQVGLSDESFIPKNVEVAPDWDYFCITINGISSSREYKQGDRNSSFIPKNVEVAPDWDYICLNNDGISSSREYKQGDCNSRSLYLNGATISTLPDWFKKAVTEKTEKLQYDRCRGMSDIVMEYDHGRLHKLKHLTVGFSFDKLKELMTTTGRVETGPVFENLEELHLRHLILLEELCVGELPPGSLSNLKVFHVRFGTLLKSVSKFVQRLPNLEKLDLNLLFKLEYVFRCEGDELEQAKLREMHLMSLNALRSICSGPAPRAMFQSLKILTVCNCDLLQSLFASDVAQCLVQLEDLLVESCYSLERVMEAVNKEKTVLPKLKNLVLIDLPMLYGAIAAVDIECPSLERLMVVGCPKVLFSTSSDLFGAFKSRNQFSFSASTSHPVQLNDPQLYKTLRGRASL